MCVYFTKCNLLLREVMLLQNWQLVLSIIGLKMFTWYLVVAITVQSIEQIKHTYHETQTVTADCGPPPVFLNGTVSYQNTTEGSEAHYHCDDGFNLEGEMTAVCRADGRWSSTPVCRPSTGSVSTVYSNSTYDPIQHKKFNSRNLSSNST